MHGAVKQVIIFPDLPNATTGVLLSEDNLLITGHLNGLVIRWDITKGTREILYKCTSKIETISCSDEKEIVVGSHAGHLFVLDLKKPKILDTIQEPTYNVHSRVWRTLYPKKNSVIMTSTYGVMNLLLRGTDGQWVKVPLSGHLDSIFGLGSLNGEIIASGDYQGKIMIWKLRDGLYEPVQMLKINRTVEDIAWHGDETFAVIDESGRIHLFEKIEKDSPQWQSVYEIDNATGFGRCIHITEDGKTIFAGTDNEIIQFDIDSQQVGSIDIKGARKIFSKGDLIFVLTVGGFLCFERKPVEVEVGFIKYRYAKISLVGHTGVGKSTLCNLITTGSPGDVKSTFGKRVWNWTIPSDDPIEKRIIFHDHGGQETVLGTFLPFLIDSDIILILFQQNDRRTFTTALQTFDQLKKSLNPKTKTFFVQTFTDQDINEVDEETIKKLVDEKQINGHLKVCPPHGRGIERLKTLMLKEVSWKDARIMIQSKYASCALETISTLQEKAVNVVSFEDFMDFYTKKLGSKVSKRHLKFLLRDLSNQGIVDFYPEISNLIIINDENYNRLRTNVPIFVEKRNGIVSFRELVDSFGYTEYLSILDAVYQNYKICIRNNDLRVFPEKLKQGQISIPKPYITLLKDIQPEEKLLHHQEIEISRLIEALSELNLSCIDASQTEGLFSWRENACIYYKFEAIGDAIRGYKVKCIYFIGGKKNTTCDRLKREFESIVESLYGPFLIDETTQVKKKVLKKNIKFDVALSFAGEQRDYVKKVATILEREGIKCFYDEFFKHKLWGTNLAEYLHEVYYSQSKWCIMFISKEYVTKAWTTHERRSAIARQIQQLGDYILPVIFDDSKVPGLQLSAIGYLDARKMSPEEVANQFLKKIEEENGTQV